MADKFFSEDIVKLRSKNQPRRSSRNKPLQRKQLFQVLSTQFFPTKYDGEALVRSLDGVQKERWVPFSVLELVKRDEPPRDDEDGRAEAHRTGQIILKNIKLDPRVEFLTTAELLQGKGTPNRWFPPDLDESAINQRKS